MIAVQQQLNPSVASPDGYREPSMSTTDPDMADREISAFIAII
jgi:hypothetical protein